MALRAILLSSVAAACLGAVACGTANGGNGFTLDAGEPADARVADAPPPPLELGDSGPREAGNVQPETDVEVVITADNAYAFGYGDKLAVGTLTGRPVTQVAGDIFNCPVNISGSGAGGFGPESYTVLAAAAPPSAYLYVVAWDDDNVTQGVLGQFKRKGGKPLYTGDGAWEVCATGKAYNTTAPAPTPLGPPLAVVNADIALCNAGSAPGATSSVGWVNAAGAMTMGAVGNLAVGEDNSDQSGSFPITCQPAAGKLGIDAAAKWMWYTPDGRPAFNSRGTRSYHIFRLPASELPPPPTN